MAHSLMRRLPILLVLALTASFGCATTVPYTGAGPHPQIERGKPNRVVDGIGNFFGVIGKIVLWNHRVNEHYVSPEVETKLVAYLDSRNDLPMLEDTKVRLNQYNPIPDWGRLVHNKHVKWPYRLTLGTISMLFETILPGRLFAGSDYYNPWTNTAHLYSDLAPVGLHELGHAYDTSHRKYKGTYAFIYIFPLVPLWHEYKASKETIRHLRDSKDRDTELSSYKLLYPAYGSYFGGYLGGAGYIGAVSLGHVLGRSEASEREEYYRQLDAGAAPAGSSAPAAAPVTSSP
jgi:hypothetical protein